MKPNDAWKMYESIRNDRKENLKKKVLKNKLRQNIVYGVLAVAVFTFLFLVVFIICREAYEIKNELYTYNIMEQLNYYYKDKFTILFPEDIDLKDNLTPNGKYVIKSEKGIEFNAYKDEAMLSTDYLEKLCQMYFDEWMKEYKCENIKSIGSVKNYKGVDLSEFVIEVQFDNFYAIEDSIAKLEKVIDYINKKLDKVVNHFNYSYNIVLELNDFKQECSISMDSFVSKNVSEKFKIDYVNYLEINNEVDENVNDIDIEKYYKPSTLNVYLNVGDDVENLKNYKVEVNAKYDVNFGDYRLSMVRIVSKFNNIEKCEARLDGSIMNFKYNGKKYKFSDDAYGITEIKGKLVPYEWNIKMIEQFFNAEVIYDLDNRRVIINT